MAENGGILPTAHYTVGPEESSIKNTGENGAESAPTAQNTHSERLERVLGTARFARRKGRDIL